MISPVAETEYDRFFDTLMLAFAADPCERWLYPSASTYLAQFPLFLRAFGGADGRLWQVDDFAAVAFWLAPGTPVDGDSIAAVLTASVPADRHADTFAVLDQMAAAHPDYPHWYLPWLGVDPARQGRGLGADLLAQCLRIVDADRVPAYLETPNPRTVPFYQRHGFEVVATAQAGACPPLACMLRAAA
ncbi:MAG TPA: GNAT family N-acetyltransferase [Micromonosporaceae bacterium]